MHRIQNRKTLSWHTNTVQTTFGLNKHTIKIKQLHHCSTAALHHFLSPLFTRPASAGVFKMRLILAVSRCSWSTNHSSRFWEEIIFHTLLGTRDWSCHSFILPIFLQLPILASLTKHDLQWEITSDHDRKTFPSLNPCQVI